VVGAVATAADVGVVAELAGVGARPVMETASTAATTERADLRPGRGA
jgi:hypothetical protein